MDTTLQTYNRSAQQLAEYFSGIGPRVDDIDRAVELWGGSDKPDVIELGCGDGRDAEVVADKAYSYLGVDYSEEFVRLAEARRIKLARFLVSDLTNFEYAGHRRPDIIFAFASLLHLSIEQNGELLAKSREALNDDGVIYLSLKHANTYCSETQVDKYGERLFYYYHPDEMVEAAGPGYKELYRDFQSIGSTRWFTLALRKSREQ